MSSSAASRSSEDLRGRHQQSPLASQRAKENRGTSADPKSVSRLFPLGYKEGFSQWWASIPAATAEHRVLSFIPYLQKPPTHTQTGKTVPTASSDSLITADSTQAAQVATNSVDDPHGPRRWRSSMVQLGGRDRALNEFSVERVGEPVEQNLVILHGYGAGLGFFYKNFESLSRARGWQLYALDLLGMGRSTRPPFKMRSKQRQQAITEAEDWFIDALEEWRLKRKIDKFTLLGHSLGGYMAVAYALKYPGHLNKLILASPVGIPEDPYAVNADMPEPADSTMGTAFSQDQGQPSHLQPVGDNNNFLNARSKAAKNGANGDTGNPPRKPLPKWLIYLWDANFSPFSLVRWSGPLGPRLVSGWTSRRFSHLPSDEARALHDYVYSLFRLRGSGEYALAYILAPGAFARSPLIRRIHGVGRQALNSSVPPPASSATAIKRGCRSQATPPATPQPSPSQSVPASTSQRRETGIPIVLMYGEQDWMDIAGGHAAKSKIEEETARVLKDASPEECETDRGSAKVIIIKKAGHHLYLDGWEEFNEVMLAEMREVSDMGSWK